MKNPFAKLDAAELTEKEEEILYHMFDTPEKITALRKAFQLTSSDENGHRIPNNIQNLNLEGDPTEVVNEIKLAKKLDRYLKITLLGIYNNSQKFKQNEIDDTIRKQEELKESEELDTQETGPLV